MEHLWAVWWRRGREGSQFGVDARWQDVEGSAMLLHDKQQPGASSDKALIQKIPPSFAENPNEDLKCPAGRRPGGCGYTLPLLALPVIVSLSPHWPSLAGDERDMTAWWAYVHRLRACMAPWEARFHSLPQTTGVTWRLRKKDKTNRSCWQKIEKIMGKGTPLHPRFTLECKVNLTQKWKTQNKT